MEVNIIPHYISFSESQEIRRRWIEKGKPQCDHPQIAREEINGAHSDYVCTSCGEASTNREHLNK